MIGILGGTFNPPHLGHLAVARAAREELGLDLVLLMPVHTPPHKPGGEDPGPRHRLAMCELLTAPEAAVEVSALEVDRGGPSYTVDTLKAVHAQHPESQITFIVGADTARTLTSWREPQQLLELARLAVAARTGSARREVLDTVARVLGASRGTEPTEVPEVRFLDLGEIEVSSSMVRERVARGADVADLVGRGVASYIAANGLYRAPGAPAGALG